MQPAAETAPGVDTEDKQELVAYPEQGDLALSWERPGLQRLVLRYRRGRNRLESHKIHNIRILSEENRYLNEILNKNHLR